MSLINEIRPRSKGLVIDLVRAAGVDVSDWGNYSRGPDGAATNPKYCYEWAFIEPGHVVVLNLWYELMREEQGSIFQEINLLRTAQNLQDAGRSSVQRRRAHSANGAIRAAFEKGLQVRVIVNDGVRRKEGVRGPRR